MAHLHEIRWCTPEQLGKLDPPLDAAVRWHCLQALKEVGEAPKPDQS